MKRAFFLMAVPLLIAAALVLPAQALADSATAAAIVQAGGTATLAFDVTNQTASEQSYTLTATGLPPQATADFTEDGTVSTTVAVPANSDLPVTMQVQIPAGTPVGTYAGSFTATRGDGATSNVPFVLAVQNAYALKITSTAQNISAFSGKDFALDVAVSNTGAAALTNVVPAMDMPSKWVLLSDPANVPSLDPGAEAVFHLTITVPASQVAIDQPVSVSVTSDQVSSPASDLSVRVQSNPVFLPVAAAVVVLALIAVAVYFRLKGRR